MVMAESDSARTANYQNIDLDRAMEILASIKEAGTAAAVETGAVTVDLQISEVIP